MARRQSRITSPTHETRWTDVNKTIYVQKPFAWKHHAQLNKRITWLTFWLSRPLRRLQIDVGVLCRLPFCRELLWLGLHHILDEYVVYICRQHSLLEASSSAILTGWKTGIWSAVMKQHRGQLTDRSSHSDKAPAGINMCDCSNITFECQLITGLALSEHDFVVGHPSI